MQKSHRLGTLYTSLIVCGALSGAALADQPVFYTFDSIVDGHTYPSSVLSGDYFYLPDGSPDGTEIANYTGNTLFIDSSFQAAGNAPGFAGGNTALWGNPTDTFAYLDFYFGNRDAGVAQSVSFDFAWAIQGQHAPTTLDVSVWDSQGTQSDTWFNLSSFSAGPAFGGADGAAGQVSFNAANLGLQDIHYASINLMPVSQANTFASGEFAIDNLSIDGGSGGGGGGSGDPLDSNIYPAYQDNDGNYHPGLLGVGSNALKKPGLPAQFNLGFAVSNDGTGDTTYSVNVTGDFTGSQSNLVILAGQALDPGVNAYLDSSLPSGQYTGTATIINELNGNDSDEAVSLTWTLYDAPQITDNSGLTLSPGEVLSVANAAAGPHAGARRASLHITGALLVGQGFTISGDLLTNGVVYAGDTDTATVGFNPLGLLAGVYDGSYTLDFRMTNDEANAATGFLNYADAVPSMTWQLTHTVTAQNSVTAPVSNGQNFGDAMIGVSNGTTAAALIDGVSTSSQSVSAMFIANPNLSNAQTFGEAVEIAFSIAPDLYVLQMAYLDSLLPAGVNELDLRVLVEHNNQWVESILLNSDGGAGAMFFHGSYDAYLATLNGQATALSTFGVDDVNNQIWAVLDHNSVFIVGSTTAIPEPASAAMLGVLGLAMLHRRRRPTCGI